MKKKTSNNVNEPCARLVPHPWLASPPSKYWYLLWTAVAVVVEAEAAEAAEAADVKFLLLMMMRLGWAV